MFRVNCLLGLAILILVSISACSNKSPSDSPGEQAVQFKDTQSLTNEINSTPSIVNNDGFIFLRVDHHKVECEGYFVSLCFRVQEKAGDDWRYFYEDIEGFDYEWGNTYEILVRKESLDSGLTDAPQSKYTLQQVLSIDEHGFAEPYKTISRKVHERMIEIEPGIFSHLGMMKFSCDPQSCVALRSAIDQKQSVLLSFLHSKQNASPVLKAVLCADGPKTFTTSCG